MICFGTTYHLLTYYLRHKHDFPWYHKATDFICGMSMICPGSTTPPYLFPILGNPLLWIPPLLGIIPLAYLLYWYDGPNFCARFIGTFVVSNHFVVGHHPIFEFFFFENYFTPSTSMILEIFMIPATPSRSFGNLNKASNTNFFYFA